jgi:hypothetical protein
MLLLEPHEVTPEKVTIDGQRDRGYLAALFRDVFERYFPASQPISSRQVGETASTEEFSAVSQVVATPSATTCENDIKAHGISTSTTWTLEKPREREKAQQVPLEMPELPAFLNRTKPTTEFDL